LPADALLQRCDETSHAGLLSLSAGGGHSTMPNLGDSGSTGTVHYTHPKKRKKGSFDILANFSVPNIPQWLNCKIPGKAKRTALW
jgi:hypothetical protein